MFIDTHAHITFTEFKDEIPKVIKRAETADVKKIINVGSNFSTSKKSVEIAVSHLPLAIRKNPKANSQKPCLPAGRLKANVYASVGCHPIHLAKDIVEEAKFDGQIYKFKTKKEIFEYEKYKKLAQSSDKVVAIGETGLDYFRLEENDSKLKTKNENVKTTTKNLNLVETKQIQRQVFEEHIKLAQELNLPLILHCRGSEDNPYDAYDEMLEILKSRCHSGDLKETRIGIQRREGFPTSENDSLKGVIHCFGGNLTQAQEFIKLGFYIGVTGIVTFKNATELQNIVKDCPLDRILIETDCPFLAPRPLTPELYPKGFLDVANRRSDGERAVPYRGKPARNACGNAWQARRNEPAYVIEVARKIAELKNISIEEVEKTTTQNAIKLFKLSAN